MSNIFKGVDSSYSPKTETRILAKLSDIEKHLQAFVNFNVLNKAEVESNSPAALSSNKKKQDFIRDILAEIRDLKPLPVVPVAYPVACLLDDLCANLFLHPFPSPHLMKSAITES